MKTYWISKYALSGGVQQKRGELAGEGRYVSTGPHGFYRLGKDVHETPEAAANAAEEMRERKIATLKKQLANLEKMSFEVPA